MICAYSGVEVSQEYQLLTAVNALNCFREDGVELIFDIWWGRQGRGVGAEECDRSIGGMKPESQNAFSTFVTWLDHLEQGIFDCETHSMLSSVLLTLSLPKESVVFLLQRTCVRQSGFLEGSYVNVQSQELVIDDRRLSCVADVLEVA